MADSKDESPKNVCIGVESNFAVFIKTVINYFIITAISLIAIFTIFNMNKKIRDMKNPLLKNGLLIVTIAVFTSIVGGLNPVAYDSIVIGVGICLGFILFTNVYSVEDLKGLLKLNA